MPGLRRSLHLPARPLGDLCSPGGQCKGDFSACQDLSLGGQSPFQPARHRDAFLCWAAQARGMVCSHHVMELLKPCQNTSTQLRTPWYQGITTVHPSSCPPPQIHLTGVMHHESLVCFFFHRRITIKFSVESPVPASSLDSELRALGGQRKKKCTSGARGGQKPRITCKGLSLAQGGFQILGMG